MGKLWWAKTDAEREKAIDKLPKWAGVHIDTLQMRLDEATSRIEAFGTESKSRVVVETAYNETFRIPERSKISFDLSKGPQDGGLPTDKIDVSIGTDDWGEPCVHIYHQGRGLLVVRPSSSNAMKLRVAESSSTLERKIGVKS